MNRFTIFLTIFLKPPISHKGSNLGLAVLMPFADALTVERDYGQYKAPISDAELE
ncbi:hypothetical protein [Bacillus paralicheniformis]|uniref:hypothetical protein n=1 Tax=Bacillus TaxID=1386 RepID=UPI0014319212|nr:hypothetical protein [Bacillus paralicheniformis]